MKRNSIQKQADIIARKAGYGFATEIKFNPNITEGRVISHTPFGYRKFTTGEYVPNKYLANFGWKNTYYQHSKTVVELPSRVLLFKNF